MEVSIRRMGNSQGILIHKPILVQLGLEGTVDLQVRGGVIGRVITTRVGTAPAR
jgi:antitoxin MazE